MKVTGELRKMHTKLEDVVQYSIPLSDELVDLNEWLGKKISLEYSGEIYCIATGEKIKKSYNQGFSYKSFMSLALLLERQPLEGYLLWPQV